MCAETLYLDKGDRDLLVALIDLVNDARVTQIDHDEVAEMHRLWAKLTAAVEVAA